jgi:phenylacetate-coenzyme A ligase PaaK-like adenylate-forming protein
MNREQLSQYKKSIFEIQSIDEFNQLALQAFFYQYENVPVYRSFCDHLGKVNPKNYSEIPCLPISFFKTHAVHDHHQTVKVFKSSGTTKSVRSIHCIADISLYEQSFLNTFRMFFGAPEDKVIIGLLPNYMEQGESSLVYMVEKLIHFSTNDESGFYLNNYESLIQLIKAMKTQKREVILFGVSYALLDLADMSLDFSGVKIIETGGMKGRRKELLKEELHAILKNGLNVNKIYSEYGMTELLSQAYLSNELLCFTPPWMKVRVRDVNDPLSFLGDGSTGAINVFDLANIHSCSFIATDDLGLLRGDQFEIKGRLDLSDIRGCNLLVN